MIGDIGIQAMANSISLGQLPFLKNLKMKEVSLLSAQKKIILENFLLFTKLVSSYLSLIYLLFVMSYKFY